MANYPTNSTVGGSGIAPQGIPTYTPAPAANGAPQNVPTDTVAINFAGGSGGDPTIEWGGGVLPEYGGQVGDANAVAQQLATQGKNFQGRTGASLSGIGSYAPATGGALNLPQVAADNASARASQLDAASMLGTAAAGGGPSAPIGSSISGGFANAFAAGKAGGALGMSQAQSGLGSAGTSAIGQDAAGFASEVANAQQNYAGALGNLRGGDINAQSLDQSFGLAQAQLSQGQQNENTRAQLQSQGQANSVLLDQLQAGTSSANTQEGNLGQLGAQQIGLSAAQQNSLIGASAGALGGVGNAVGNAMSSGSSDDASADGSSGDYSDSDDVVNSDVRMKKDVNFADAIGGMR